MIMFSAQFSACLASEFATSANMTPKMVFLQTNHFEYFKTQNSLTDFYLCTCQRYQTVQEATVTEVLSLILQRIPGGRLQKGGGARG